MGKRFRQEGQKGTLTKSKETAPSFFKKDKGILTQEGQRNPQLQEGQRNPHPWPGK
jgi:hypothetical protein